MEPRPFRRSNTIWPTNLNGHKQFRERHPACGTFHEPGYCPIKLAGPEFCNLCGMAHFGIARTCPHIQSETQVCVMLNALRQSAEPRHLVQEASRYLQGVKGTLVQAKKIKAEKLAKALEAQKGATLPNGSPNANTVMSQQQPPQPPQQQRQRQQIINQALGQPPRSEVKPPPPQSPTPA